MMPSEALSIGERICAEALGRGHHLAIVPRDRAKTYGSIRREVLAMRSIVGAGLMVVLVRGRKLPGPDAMLERRALLELPDIMLIWDEGLRESDYAAALVQFRSRLS